MNSKDTTPKDEDIHDPMLRRLFTEQNVEIPDEGFSDSVMLNIEKHQQSHRHYQIGIAAGLLLLGVILLGPLSGFSNLLTQWLTTPFVNVHNTTIQQIALPFNSAAGVAALVFLMIHGFARKIFSR